MGKFRTITKQQLLLILERHKEWLTTRGTSGEMADLSHVDFRQIAKKRNEPGEEAIDLSDFNLSRANLEGANLEEIDLSGSILQKANLESAYLNDSFLNGTKLQGAILSKANLQRVRSFKADLQGCNLFKANLRRATLRRVNLQNSNIRLADFKEAILQDSNFQDTKGFQIIQFAGADLSGAKLPIESLSLNEALSVIENGTKIATKISIFIFLLCIYSWLTIATTRDASLLTNSATSQLPVTGTQIPIVYYYVVAPSLLLCVYLYFILYLLRLFENIADLPAFFPDGKPADKKIYPSIKTGLVRGFFYRLQNNKPPLFNLQVLIAGLLMLIMVPGTLFLFHNRYLYRHDWKGTTLHILLTVVSFFFFLKAIYSIESLFQYYSKVKTKKTFTIQIVVWSLFIIIYSIIGIHGIPSWSIKPLFTADFRGEEVSIIPEVLFTNKDADVSLIKGPRLDKTNLQYLSGERATLVRAILRGANLTEANLTEAVLIGANFDGATLRESNLSGAMAMGADFSNANLQEANLQKADLRGAIFLKADLRGAKLRNAIIRNATFEGAIINGADLRGASVYNSVGLTQEQINTAIIDETTVLPKGLMPTKSPFFTVKPFIQQ